MAWYAPFVHLLNFLAPALWMATCVVVLHRTIFRRHSVTISVARQWRWLFSVSVLVLVAGWLLTQHDGAMFTYMALALVVGCTQVFILHKFRQPQAMPTGLAGTVDTVNTP